MYESRNIILAVPKGIEVSLVGMKIKCDLGFDDWLHVGEMLKTAEGSVQFWIGDYLNYGEKAYGEKYAQAVHEKQAATWMNYAWVARKVEISTRVENLTWAHHRLVAHLESGDQNYWLAQAMAKGLSYRDLATAIKAAKPTPPLPEGKYRVIYADPPWQYADELIEGYGAATHHYPTMSIEELCALPVADLAADDSVLFLWVTVPMAVEGSRVIPAWGFSYKAMFVWDKVKHNFGHYNSVRHELLLVCTRGQCLPDSRRLEDSVVSIERSGKHSEKPARFAEIIEAMYPLGPRIELFARGNRPGWDAWGGEPEPCGEQQVREAAGDGGGLRDCLR